MIRFCVNLHNERRLLNYFFLKSNIVSAHNAALMADEGACIVKVLQTKCNKSNSDLPLCRSQALFLSYS